MKIGTKVLVLCLILVTVPTLLLGIVAYSNSSGAINEQIDTLLSTQIHDVYRMTASTYDLSQAKLKDDLTIMKTVFYQYGTPDIKDGKLVLSGGSRGTYVVNDNTEIVDRLAQETGSSASIFQKVGNQAVRISTNVIGEDGKRALGTTVSDTVYTTVIGRGVT